MLLAILVILGVTCFLMGHTHTVKCYSLVVSALSVRVSVPLVCYTCLRLLFPFRVSLVAAAFLPTCMCVSLVALVHICPSLVSTTNLSSLRFLLVVAFLSPWLLLSCASLGACASLHLLMVFLFLFPLVVSAFVLTTSLLSPLHIL